MGVRWCAGKSNTPIPEPAGDGGEAAQPVPETQCICENECHGALTCKPGTYGPDDPGGGPYDPATGVREWIELVYDRPTQLQGGTLSISWDDILGHWRELALDLHDRNIDVGSGILCERSWAWLTLHVGDIAENPVSRLHLALKGA
jgi:hypothetical protein